MATSGMAKLKARRAAEQKDRRAYVNEVRIKTGQKIKLWFFGSGEEPIVRDAHRCMIGPKQFRVYTCAITNCVACYLFESGNKIANRATGRSSLNAADAGFYHKVQAKDARTGAPIVRRKDGEPFMNDEPCKGEKVCRYCLKKDPKTGEPIVKRFRGGHKLLDLSTMFAEVLLTQYEIERGKCATCWAGNGDEESGTGTIEITGYACPECEHPIKLKEYDPTPDDEGNSPKHSCLNKKCKKVVEPIEVVVCTNECDEPRRVTLADGPWYVTRSGTEKSTSYAFQFAGVQEMPEWVMELTPTDLVQHYGPMTPKRLAELLHVPNPFRGVVGKPGSSDDDVVGYGDEEKPAEDEVPAGEEEEGAEDPFPEE